MLTNLHGGMANQMNNMLGINASFALIISFIFFAIIHLFVTKWLWNNVLVLLVPAIKRATSIWQMVGLTILLTMIMPK